MAKKIKKCKKIKKNLRKQKKSKIDIQMSESVFGNVLGKINDLVQRCIKCEVGVAEVQNEIINVMNVVVMEYKEIIRTEYLNEIYISLSKMMFCQNVEMIVIEMNKIIETMKRIIVEVNDISQNINWYEEVKRRVVQKDMFMSELMVSQELDYENRIRIFKDYINNEIKIKNENDKNELVDTIRRLIIILFIPIHTKTTRVGKNDIKMLLKCNHSGKTKETCKGRDCKYEVVITIGYDGMNKVIETGQHNHSLDYSFVTSKTCPLLKSEKELLPKRKDDIINFVANHPHVMIPFKKYRQIQNSMDNNQVIENAFLKNLFFENESFIKITNTFTNGSVHSITFIHKKVAQMEYSKRKWYIDDTSNTNIYNKNMIAIIVKDDNSFNQLMSFGYLYDQTENSFKIYLNQLYSILTYGPEIIICDRCGAQFNAIKEVYPDTKVFFCRVHIERSLIKYFKKDHIIMKMFYLMINMKLSEEEMIKVWKTIIKNNIENLKQEENTEEVSEETKMTEETEETEEDEKEQEDSLYEAERIDTQTKIEDNTTSEEIKRMLEEAKKLNIKKGIMCLIDLLEHKDNWLPSECLKCGIYHEYTTNRVEGFFGHLKRLTKHNRLSYYLLTDHVYALANTMYNNIMGIELPDGIIDKNDERFKSLTEFSKKVLKIQCEMMKEGKINEENQYCISCEIRKVNPHFSWPCSHLMKTRQKMKMNYLINYEDLPKMAYKSKRMNIIWSNKSINNIEMPKEYTMMGNVVVNKQIHNSNVKPRNKVEYRRRSSKDMVFNELQPYQPKRKTAIKNNEIEDDETISEIKEAMNEDDCLENQNKPTIDNEKERYSTSDETMIEETDEYDSDLNKEQFEKVMNTFEIPNRCMICELSEYGKPCTIPNDVKGIETIIFPYKSNKKYGILAYVNKMKLIKKQGTKCLIHLKHDDSNYPYFMKGIRKTLKERFKLRDEPLIRSIQLKKCVKPYKYNGYTTLFLLETFIKTRNSDHSKNQQKQLIKYLTNQNMIKSFKRYKEIIN